MAGCERDAGRQYESGYKKIMERKKEQEIRNELNLRKNKKISEFACDKLSSPPVVENSASAMLKVRGEESDLF